MAIIIATIAFLLCWIWIETSLFIANKNSNDSNVGQIITYNKFYDIPTSADNSFLHALPSSSAVFSGDWS